MDVQDLIDEVIAREGGYTDHPADRGGATNMGITHAVARANGYFGAMQALPRATAESLYRRLYWEQPGYAFVAELAGGGGIVRHRGQHGPADRDGIFAARAQRA